MANTYLSRGQSTSSTRTKCTLSAWIKRGNLSGGSYHFFVSFYNSTSDRMGFYFNTADTLDVYSPGTNSCHVSTNRLLRDTNAWYHVVFKIDTTQSTASDRVKIYVNGQEETDLGNTTYPNQNDNMPFGTSSYNLYIGNYDGSQYYFDGSMSHVHFCDGYAYDASSFGSTDSTTGEWKINTNPNVSYGTNGFTILKDGNTITDQSSNSNDFTLSGGTVTNTEDCPSNVFCTMNPLNHDYANTNTDLGAGSTFVYPRANDNYNYAVSTLAMPKGNGKFYAEAKYITYDTVTAGVGIVDMDYVPEIFYQNRNLPEQTASTYIGRVIYLKNGYSIIPSTENNSYGSSYANGDIIQIACDMENGAIYFGKNGTWQNSGDPTSGASKTGAIDISSQSWYTGTTHWGFWCGDKGTNHDRFAWNFGNGNFASASGSFGSQTYSTTAVSSAGTNASGIGIFEYDVPTGYTALSTKGLNE